MEFNNSNDNNGNGGEEQQQLQRSARKRELANGKPAAGEEDQPGSSKKNREEGNGLDLELENLSREELIKLVRKQMEAAKKETEESQHKVEELTSEMAKLNAEYQKLLEIVQLPHEKEEEIANDAEKPMKIQLSLETWYDWLAFVPRHRLGQVVPLIGDRKFASIVQKFLHEYGEIKIADIEFVAPYEEDPSGHPRMRVMQNHRQLRFEIAEAQMPANIKNFNFFILSYFDQSVLNFMQKFQQNGLLDNVNLSFAKLPSKDIPTVLCHLLPMIDGIVLIQVEDSAQLVDFYDAGSSKEIHELNMKMMEETRFLALNNEYDPAIMHANTIDLYCRWLYQTARADGKPRVLLFERRDLDSVPISLFIDRLKKDFLKATDPVIFFIRIDLPKAIQTQEDICFDNGKTKERLLTKMEPIPDEEEVVLLISRYPLASTKKWIEENEKQVLDCEFSADKTIYLCKELKVVPI